MTTAEVRLEDIEETIFETFNPEYESHGEFIEYLHNTLIPDLKNDGFIETARDFEEAIFWILAEKL